MPEGVHITGIGCISGIGGDIEGTLSSLSKGNSGIGPIQLLDTVHKERIPAAEVPHTDEELLKRAGATDPELYSRTTLLGAVAAREAMDNAGLGSPDPTRTGLINGTTTGGMRITERYYRDYIDKGERCEYIERHDCGDSTERIADLLGIRGRITTINTACSSSANSLMLGARMIRAGLLDRAVCGGTDALTKFTLNGFNTLFILDHQPCRPFDDGRKGLNLGEGSGFVVLEREGILEKEKRDGIAELIGYGNSNDAYHQTASSPEGDGAFHAMEQAIGMSGKEAADVDHVNAHGTGTPNNDLSEGRALTKLFGEGDLPAFSSTKSFTGHTLGASGGIEAVISVLSLREGRIFPNLNFSDPMSELELRPETELKEADLRRVLSNSFGFGGNNTSLLIQKD